MEITSNSTQVAARVCPSLLALLAILPKTKQFTSRGPYTTVSKGRQSCKRSKPSEKGHNIRCVGRNPCLRSSKTVIPVRSALFN
eukprot:4349800-Amphidinium_carterae.1